MELLDTMVLHARADCARAAHSRRAARLTAWRSWVRAHLIRRAPLCQYVRARHVPSPALLQAPDGSWTNDPASVDRLLRDAWDPIFRAYAPPASSPPSWAAFASRFRHVLPPRSSVELPALSASLLADTLSHASRHTAAGPDGWTMDELRALPLPLLDFLASFFSVVEATGAWPPALLQATVVLIPKGDSAASPSALRPITVLPAPYRLWALARLRSLWSWQEAWISHTQHGFRPAHCAPDAAWLWALQLEEALSGGSPCCGALLDWAKAFDRLPHSILFPLAEHAGLPRQVLLPLRYMLTHLQRRFRTPCGIGSAFVATNGIPQGDPVSVLWMNLFMAVWSRLLLAEAPGSTPRSYADDAGVLAHAPPALSRALSLTELYARLSGQALNPGKCTTFATSPPHAAALLALTLSGHPLRLSPVLRDLGFPLSTSRSGRSPLPV